MSQPGLKQNSYYLWRSGPQRILGHTDMFQSLGGKVPCERMRTAPDKQLHRTQEDNLPRHAENGWFISDLTTSLNINKNLTISEKLKTRYKGKERSQFSPLATSLINVNVL